MMHVLARAALVLAAIPLQSVCAATAPAGAPVVREIVPANSALSVEAGQTLLQVRFDRAMRDDGYSITGLPGCELPVIAGKPRFSPDGKTFTMPIKLRPATRYCFSINSERFTNFRSRDSGVAAIPFRVTFVTAP